MSLKDALGFYNPKVTTVQGLNSDTFTHPEIGRAHV